MLGLLSVCSCSPGDKENHTPSIHLPQMLYIWPYFVFFSFPILYPYFLNALFPPTLLPPGLRFGPTRLQLPRWIVAVSAMGTMMALVYFNTIIHPFILADNRHYMFYVFRMFILRRPFTKYLNIPVYYLCAWATMTALGGSISYLPGIDGDPGTNTAETRNGMAYKKTPSRRTNLERGHHVSFALVWLLATTFSLVTAPLVEPRYFIVPWLMWRLHVVSPLPHGDAASKARRKRPKHDHRLWLETVWFLAVNAATAYIFLYLGFEWPQEPGETQRFMW